MGIHLKFFIKFCHLYQSGFPRWLRQYRDWKWVGCWRQGVVSSLPYPNQICSIPSFPHKDCGHSLSPVKLSGDAHH